MVHGSVAHALIQWDAYRNFYALPSKPPAQLPPSNVVRHPASPVADHGIEATDPIEFLASIAGAATLVIDPERRRIESADERVAAMLGYAPDALNELPVEVFTDVFPGVLDAPVRVVGHGRGRLSWVGTWRRRDGSLVHLHCHSLEQRLAHRRRLLVVARTLDDRFDEAALELAQLSETQLSAASFWMRPDGQIVHTNTAFRFRTRHVGPDLAGRYFWDISSSGHTRAAWTAIWEEVESDVWVSLELNLARADQSDMPAVLAMHSAVVDGERLICAFVSDNQDAQRQEGGRDRYALAALGANDGLWDWHLGKNNVHYSSRWAALVGDTDDELPPTPETWLERIHPEDRNRVQVELDAHLENETAHFLSEHRLQHRSGTYRWMLVRGVAVRNVRGTAVRLAGSMSDITHRKNAEARLRFEAFHDPLTGLANRALFIRRLQGALATAQTPDAPSHFAVLFLDVDGFKLVNDSLGHTVGDMLLRAIASRLKRCVRGVDTVARLGGDEFTVLIEQVEEIGDIEQVAARVQEEIGVPFNLRGYEIFSSVSLGVVLSGPNYHEAEELLRDANIAMYRAKASGRGRLAHFDTSMRSAAVHRLTMETDLRRALERNELRLNYQPLIDLKTGRIKGFEALVRWHSGKRGQIMPSDFIPLAEETGLIVPIGRWTLQTACEEAVRWAEDHVDGEQLSVSVNLSGRQLILPYLVDEVREILEATGITPSRLNLEITESVLMENAEAARMRLVALKELGVCLHIDDFGTGYSSLAYLHRFPIDTLKIDRSFISDTDNYEDPWAIVATIQTLASRLGMTVTAEGVEEKVHLDKLRELNCDTAQGYYIARPLDGEHLDALVRENRRW
ncbi:MAG: diguanylate cyclase (GGDEF)-like protein/PAS domain S-box-containing protein [Myxococcota bacterium]|jgi:diguanylate cyclase (GGDEF)-like protein/PAS domain S-box-containing protein